MDLDWATATELAASIRSGAVRARDVLEAQIDRVERWNPRLNAIIASDWDRARSAADAADVATQQGAAIGALHGIVMSVKDTIDVEGMSSTAGSASLAGRVAARDAESVRRLRSAGAIIGARSNAPAFADDAQTDSDLYGRTNNPWDLSRTAGGSSGGAAAAVAAGLVPLELGSDRGGSLRIPAHFCGVAAHKPTEGMVPTDGHVPPPPGRPAYPDVLSVIGPIARSVADLRLAMEVIAGVPASAVTAPGRPDPASRAPRRRQLAWSPDTVTTSGREMRRVLGELAGSVERAGFDVQELPLTAFDLVGAGELHARIVDVVEGTWFGRESPDYAAVVQLMAERQAYAEQLDHVLAKVDAWMLPITPVSAPQHRPKLAPIEVDGHPRDYWEVLIGGCRPFNLTGNPATALPVAIGSDGLPLGVQLVGRRWHDFALLDTAEELERIVSFGHHPPQPREEPAR
jgi:amidase